MLLYREWTRQKAHAGHASCVTLVCRLVNEGMRHVVPGRRSVEAASPVGIRAAQFGGRARIGVETQFNQRGSAPFVPVAELGCGQPETPQPGHRGAREGLIIIPGPGY